MDQIIIDKYKINFYNKIVPYFDGGRIEKIPDTDHVVSSFLIDWSADDINNYVIPNLDSVINGNLDEFETGTEIMLVVVESSVTTFYPDSREQNFPSMATADFKEILIGWSEFLLQPPLSGAKV